MFLFSRHKFGPRPTTAPLQHHTNVRGTTPEWERAHKADLSAWFAWVLNPRPISFLRLSFVSLTQDDTPTSILPVVTTTLQSVLMGGRNEIGRGLSPRRTQAVRFPTGLLTSHQTIKQNDSVARDQFHWISRSLPHSIIGKILSTYPREDFALRDII